MLTRGKAFYRLVLYRSNRSIVDNTGNTLTTVLLILINLGAGNDFTICSF